VDGIEREESGKMQVIRLNMQDQAGRQLARQYGALVTPTFIYLDAQGVEQWRQVGSIDAKRVRASLEKP
jgi:protein-disulfide isomerase